MKQTVSICWLRRDLRLLDNSALNKALSSEHPVLPLFIFDTNILNQLEDKTDARVTFIYDQLLKIHNQLKEKNSGILIKIGDPIVIWQQLLEEYNIAALYANRDYEPYARQRDKGIYELLQKQNIPFYSFKDHVIFEKGEATKDDGTPYVVFTPYSKKWKQLLAENPLQIGDDGSKKDNYLEITTSFPSLDEIGFSRTSIELPPSDVNDEIIKKYDRQRNYPAIRGTSRLGIHLRFGTISIRLLVKKAKEKNEVYLNELIWREFYQMILWHFPEVVDNNFRSKYDRVQWRNDEHDFKLWCEGQTGYPIVDAGMRELNTTGFMHNRVRMITASFLTKHLLIDWRWGEAYFASKLLDFELASNNGGWQWAAGTGTDAQPYFRIFNPESQTKKFDEDLEYIKKWVPEFQELTYAEPIVDHKFARERCLDAFKEALNP